MKNTSEFVNQHDYSLNLENSLWLKEIINNLEKEFDIFLKEIWKTLKCELDVLRTIKLFLHERKTTVLKITKNSIISESDCLTLSVITCLLSKRKWYEITIWRPDKINRYFHALIITNNWWIFKIAGKSKNYNVKEMSVQDVINRLNFFSPIINRINITKDKIKEYLHL